MQILLIQFPIFSQLIALCTINVTAVTVKVTVSIKNEF